MNYKDFYAHLFTEMYIPLAKNFWMDKNGIMHKTSTHQGWVYARYPEGFKDGGHLNRPDLYDDIYDYAYKKGNVRISIVPNENVGGIMYYSYSKAFGISNNQLRQLKDYAIENGYELKNEDDRAKELNESTEYCYGYWVGKSGETIKVTREYGHAAAATEHLRKIGVDVPKFGREGSITLNKQGFWRVVSGDTFYVESTDGQSFEASPRSQKQALELVAHEYGAKEIVFNSRPIHGILEESLTDEEYRKSWLERHEAKFDDKGRLIAYHGTPTKNLKSIKKNGFRYKSYFSLRPDYSKFIAHRYHNVAESRVIVLKVYLPLDKIDFVMSDIYATEILKCDEVSPEKVEVEEINESTARSDLYKQSKSLFDKLQTIRSSVPRYYDNEEYVKLRKEFAKISDEIEELDVAEEPDEDIQGETDPDLITYDTIEKISSRDPKNHFVQQLQRYKGKKMASDAINLRNEVLKKIKKFTTKIPYVNLDYLKSNLLQPDEANKQSVSEFFPMVIEISSSPEDDMGISVNLEDDGRISGVFEGNDEATPATIRLVNNLINPHGKMVKIYGTHGRDVTEQIKATNKLPAELYVSPDREYSRGYADLTGERETFSGYVNVNSLNQESEYDWKTIEDAEIKSFRYL